MENLKFILHVNEKISSLFCLKIKLLERKALVYLDKALKGFKICRFLLAMSLDITQSITFEKCG